MPNKELKKMTNSPQESIEDLSEDVLDLQNRLEDLLIAYNEIADSSLEEEDRLNLMINQTIKEMDKDITDLDEKGKILSQDIHLTTGQIISLYEDLSHSITQTSDSIAEQIKSLYRLLENLLGELKKQQKKYEV
jgi:archaellum component FlaC